MEPVAGSTKPAYGTVELPKREKKLWTSSDYWLLASLKLLVFALTSASYYYYALLPAWEADRSISWTKKSTLTVTWITTLFEAEWKQRDFADIDLYNIYTHTRSYTYTYIFFQIPFKICIPKGYIAYIM